MFVVYNVETLERLIKQYMHYIEDRQCMKSCLQAGHLQHMNIIHKWMENEVYSIMQLIQCYI